MTSADIAVSQNVSLNIYGHIRHCECESANSSWFRGLQIMINLGEKEHIHILTPALPFLLFSMIIVFLLLCFKWILNKLYFSLNLSVAALKN